MKNNMKIILIAVLAILLTACGASSTAGDPASEESAALTSAQIAAKGNSQSSLTEEQMVFGSLRLEQTDYAIETAQAGSLLPLWKAYQSLLQSDTTAQAEITALLSQIQNEMTVEQLAAISTMEVDFDDIPALMEELGLQVAPGDGAGDGARFGGDGRPEGIPEGLTPGQRPGGGQGPGGGQFPGGAEGLSPEQIATFQAENPDFGNRSNRGNVFLIRPLITLLESKLG